MNVVGVILGNGFLNPQVACWEFDKAPYRCAPKFALAMMLNDKLAFEADEEFRWMQSPVIYNDLRYGEYYDARLEIKSWCSPDFSASDWNLPIMAETQKANQDCAKQSRFVAQRILLQFVIGKSSKDISMISA